MGTDRGADRGLSRSAPPATRMASAPPRSRSSRRPKSASSIVVSKIDKPVEFHIHKGAKGTNGDVVIPFLPPKERQPRHRLRLHVQHQYGAAEPDQEEPDRLLRQRAHGQFVPGGGHPRAALQAHASVRRSAGGSERSSSLGGTLRVPGKRRPPPEAARAGTFTYERSRIAAGPAPGKVRSRPAPPSRGLQRRDPGREVAHRLDHLRPGLPRLGQHLPAAPGLRLLHQLAPAQLSLPQRDHVRQRRAEQPGQGRVVGAGVALEAPLPSRTAAASSCATPSRSPAGAASSSSWSYSTSLAAPFASRPRRSSASPARPARRWRRWSAARPRRRGCRPRPPAGPGSAPGGSCHGPPGQPVERGDRRQRQGRATRRRRRGARGGSVEASQPRTGGA